MAAPTQIVQSLNKRLITVPVSGAGSNVPAGTILMRGATGGTNLGVAIPITASSNTRALGVLSELHNFSLSGDATTATLVPWFKPQAPASGNTALPSHQLELADTATIIAVDYSLVSTVAVASASTVTLTITSFEANFDSGFVYCNAGTGIGQIFFVASSTSGSCVLSTTPATEPDSTTKLTKVLPMFYDTPVWKVNTTTVGTTLDSTAAAGTGRAVNLGNFIVQNTLVTQLDPKGYDNTKGYNSLSTFRLFSLMQLVDTALHPVA